MMLLLDNLECAFVETAIIAREDLEESWPRKQR